MLPRLENVLAPAKLNLFLHITGRRDDGYHLLQSVFVMIDWCDVLDFELRPHRTELTREDLTQPLPPLDLVLRAAAALQQAAGVVQGAHIRIAKHIPAQAGLGGGSSDAASTLLALNRLWGLHWPVERLMPIGAALGADVPFFLGGRNAWVEGIGEQLTPLRGGNALPAAQYVVIKPQAGLSTPAIFSHPKLNRATTRATISRFAAAPFEFGRNDLQPVAELLCEEVKKIVFFLHGFGFQARMTGSGSAVFAKLPAQASGSMVQEVLAAAAEASPQWQVRICQGLEYHPAAHLMR